MIDTVIVTDEGIGNAAQFQGNHHTLPIIGTSRNE
jgi:hypothetical protein